MALHEVKKPGELVSYRNIRGNNVSHHLSFGQNLVRGIHCAYCGEQAVVQHTIPEQDRDYSCLGCNTHYQDITPKGLIQGRTAHIIESRRRMEEAIRLKEEYKRELMRVGAIFEDPEFTPDLAHLPRKQKQESPKTGGSLGLAGAVSIVVSNAIDDLNPLNG